MNMAHDPMASTTESLSEIKAVASAGNERFLLDN